MGSFLASLFRGESNSECRLQFQVCEPSILQNTECNSSRVGGEQIHRLHARTYERGGRKELYTGEERRYTEFSFTEYLRIIGEKSRYHIVTQWRVSPDFRTFFVFCRYDVEGKQETCYSCPIPEVDRVLGL